MDRVDFSVVNAVLKTICRENGIARDRKAVLQIATLLLALWKQGEHERAALERVAREKLAEASIILPDTDTEQSSLDRV